MPSPIAVGVDGSDASLVALRWALATAAVRGADVLAVIARPAGPDRGRNSTVDAERSRELDSANAGIRLAITAAADGTAVQIEELPGSPTEVLLAVSERVDLLVVGGHGYSGWRDHFTRAVTGQLAVRTKAAVCVVRTIPDLVQHRIVVGYDGPASISAVDFAVAESARRGASTLIVSSWQYPRDTRATSAEASGLLEQSAAAALQEVAADMREVYPDVAIDTVVRLGAPVDVLADFAGTSDMLVVGSHHPRGFGKGGGFATLVVGSVTIGLLRRVTSPVVIVPHS